MVDGNASARCGISMKGIDIVVKGSVGHLSAFMAQAGNLVVLGDAGEALGDSIYEAHLYVRGNVKSLGADCIEKPLEEHHKARAPPAARCGRPQRRRARRHSAATVRRGGSTISTWTISDPTDELRRTAGSIRRRASRRPSMTMRSRRSAGRRPPASTISAAPARSGSCRISMTCCFSALPSAAIRWRATARNARPTSRSERATPRSRSR